MIRPAWLVYTDEAAVLAGVKPATVRKWVERGHLEAVEWDERDRPLYDPIRVMQVEAKTRTKRPSLRPAC